MNKASLETNQKFQLSQSNYYSDDANWNYRSKSQYWDFLQCEARALAKMKGEYKPNQNQTPLLFGNYLHSFFESKQAHKNFIDKNKQSFYKYSNKRKGLKTAFKQADKCIHTLCRDNGFKALYQGDKEKIVTGNIDVIDWMGKIDCLDIKHARFYDLKTVDDIHKKHWNEKEHRYVDFTVDRGYITQMAIYQELIEQTYGIKCTPMIIAVSKQPIPDKAIIVFDDADLREALNDVRMRQDHINHVINGEQEPKACGQCDYCRSKKSILDIDFETAGQIELY
ncbi:PD-(D/E)XK nuclease-like domain-containing protein [Apilactobacillus sp. TMW 2.2459]|uniref:PD-(D/E)XK nuclease-like domain-containing protein n=1 Tax=Apilactobacillus xinyiensis TaxID=2841032 RepID=UPI00200E16CD|nr:PD-(D/E)XK nuclease-like domain-containing protein [Apilactobacillus xinyiensis]MCL0312825.1 PD-(D/E)XK nuclease-like domain-containing protein [Apilactobacillus xinyiensis]